AKEPAFGLPALWVEAARVEEAQLAGYMVVDNATVIATHLTELIRKHCWELLSRSEVQNILDSVSKSYPKIVEELMSISTLGNVQRVMQNLLRERVPINDIMAILETILDYGAQVKEPDVLTEFARAALNRHITKQYATQDGTIPVFTLDQKYENLLLRSLQTGEAIAPNV
ncbi:MAG: FHIPEP family type III secretion protein, partial [Nitrospirae bacterium]|nr:FHIPEP family type III secretion protein [Nitrospirota bacterium]